MWGDGNTVASREAPDRDSETLGVTLRRLREEAGRTQAEQAEWLMQLAKLDTLTRREISRWENGQRIPANFWLGHIATSLGADLSALRAAAKVARQQRRAQAS